MKKSDALYTGESQSNALSTFSSAPLETRAKAALEILEPLIKDYISDYECSLQNGFEVENDKILYHERGAFATEELHMTKQRKITAFVNGIHKLVMAYLAADNNSNATHLSLDEATVDYLPRNEAFWFRGPMDADLRMVRKREGYEKAMAKRKGLPQYKLDQEKIHARHDRAIQFIGNTILQVRCKKAMAPFLPIDDELCTQGNVPEFTYDPKHVGYPRYPQNATNLSGHWTGVDKGFCHLQIVSNYQAITSPTNSTAWDKDSPHNERPDMLTCKSILSSFGQCLAQACFYGFSPLNDPTKPFVNQAVVTDGKRWKFAVYQLNKTALQGFIQKLFYDFWLSFPHFNSTTLGLIDYVR